MTKWRPWWIDLLLAATLIPITLLIATESADHWVFPTICVGIFIIGYLTIRPRMSLSPAATRSALEVCGAGLIMAALIIGSWGFLDIIWLLTVACPVVWLTARSLRAGIIWNAVMISGMGVARSIADYQRGDLAGEWPSEIANVILPLVFSIMIGTMVHAALKWGAERAELLDDLQASSVELGESYRQLMATTSSAANGESPLSAREVEVLGLVSQGCTNRQIGQQLFISPATVKTHMEHILAKLETTTRTQAVLVAHQKGLLPPA
ncbi:MAG: response regulator transcription factor [Propionibacteriaceae bacterium]|jgi:DNA-binding CsgD family transcriptional regulator|nr:response regulator transcription factor [Propionibacteriaceae bacterium]